MGKLEEIEKEITRLRGEQRDLEASRFHEKVQPYLNDIVGKTFVYRDNTYGHGGKWDTFRRATGSSIGEYHVWIFFEECQLDCEGMAKMETVVELVSQSDPGMQFLERGWRPCDSVEYETRRTQVLEQLKLPTKAIETRNGH